MATMKTKSVGFNIEDEQEKQLLTWTEDKNFSGYVKGLIARDYAQQKKEAKAHHVKQTNLAQDASRRFGSRVGRNHD